MSNNYFLCIDLNKIKRLSLRVVNDDFNKNNNNNEISDIKELE